MVSLSGQWLLHRDLLAEVYRVSYQDLATAYKQYIVVRIHSSILHLTRVVIISALKSTACSFRTCGRPASLVLTAPEPCECALASAFHPVSSCANVQSPTARWAGSLTHLCVCRAKISLTKPDSCSRFASCPNNLASMGFVPLISLSRK